MEKINNTKPYLNLRFNFEKILTNQINSCFKILSNEWENQRLQIMLARLPSVEDCGKYPCLDGDP